MLIYLSSSEDNDDWGFATDPCNFIKGKGNRRFYWKAYIKTESKFVIKFIIFLEIILKGMRRLECQGV